MMILMINNDDESTFVITTIHNNSQWSKANVNERENFDLNKLKNERPVFFCQPIAYLVVRHLHTKRQFKSGIKW